MIASRLVGTEPEADRFRHYSEAGRKVLPASHHVFERYGTRQRTGDEAGSP
jgi:hypothetical protein